MPHMSSDCIRQMRAWQSPWQLAAGCSACAFWDVAPTWFLASRLQHGAPHAQCLCLLQVWALAVGGSAESLVATGGSDATIHLWEDTTVADQAAAAEQAQQAVLKQQDLSNALQVSDCGLTALSS